VSPCVLAIDLGTGGPKVALVDRDGTVLAREFAPNTVQLHPGGGAEQRPADWWRAITTASRRLLTGRDADVRAVAVTGQWAGTVALDERGEPLGDAVIWLDSRGAAHARRLAGGRLRVAGYEPRKLALWLRRTGGAPSLSGRDALGHILWLRAERPELHAAARCFLEPIDWLGYKLSGRIATTAVTATLHWVTDTRQATDIRYDDDLIALAGLSRAQLPELLPPNAILGRLTESARAELGLPVVCRSPSPETLGPETGGRRAFPETVATHERHTPIPVIAGTPDTMSAAIGSGATRDHAAHLYIGTSAWLSCHVPYKRTDPLHAVASLPAALPGRYLVSTEQQTAGVAFERLRDVLLPGTGVEGFAELEALAASAPPGARGVLFTPWLNGERTPVDDELVRGGLHNLTLATTRADIARSVLEGVALNARWMHRVVERFCLRRLDPIAFVGGGALSPLWAQIMADALGRSVHRVEDPVSANVRGAALLAWVALGELRVAELHGRAPLAAVHAPDPGRRATYDELYKAFRTLYRTGRRARRRLAAVRDTKEALP
jgi:xylulokinase